MGHRSYSSVSSLRRCGEAYRLEKVLGLKGRDSAPALAGRAIHKATEGVDYAIAAGETERGTLIQAGSATAIEEAHVGAAEIGDLTRLRTYGRKSKDKPNGEDWDWFLSVGIPNAVANYVDWRLANAVLQPLVLPSGELGIEVPFTIRLGDDEPIRGYIDRVFQNQDNGALLVLDIKTGNKPKSTEQLGVYRQALLAGGLDVTYGQFVYGLKSEVKTTPDIDLTMWTTERLSQIYGQADLAIKYGIYIPNPGDACFICNVSEHCAYFAASVV